MAARSPLFFSQGVPSVLEPVRVFHPPRHEPIIFLWRNNGKGSLSSQPLVSNLSEPSMAISNGAVDGSQVIGGVRTACSVRRCLGPEVPLDHTAQRNGCCANQIENQNGSTARQLWLSDITIAVRIAEGINKTKSTGVLRAIHAGDRMEPAGAAGVDGGRGTRVKRVRRRVPPHTWTIGGTFECSFTLPKPHSLGNRTCKHARKAAAARQLGTGRKQAAITRE